MELQEPEIIDQLRTYMTSELLGRSLDLDAETPLIEEGYLTSLQTVELVMFISDRFGVEIEPEEIDEERFRSLSTIASLVRGKQVG